MPLYVKDREVDELVQHLAVQTGETKTEIVKRALEREKRRLAEEDLLATVRRLGEAVLKKANPELALPADRDFIDSLYE